MKFSELKIGDEFKINNLKKEAVKIEKYQYCLRNYFGNYELFNIDKPEEMEVTQINKKSCSNCKFLDLSRCTKCFIEISNYCSVKKPDTFHCSEFERKEG